MSDKPLLVQKLSVLAGFIFGLLVSVLVVKEAGKLVIEEVIEDAND